MTKQRSADEAMKALSDAQEAVIQDGGVIHEDAVWEASEMALDGASKESMVKRLKQARAEAYKPRGVGGRQGRIENLTKEEVLDYQEQATLFARLINTWDGEMIRRYLEQTCGQVDGTMDVILPHFMSIAEMRKAQPNMRFLRSMGEHILAVQKLAGEFVQSEAA